MEAANRKSHSDSSRIFPLPQHRDQPVPFRALERQGSHPAIPPHLHGAMLQACMPSLDPVPQWQTVVVNLRKGE
jgi:hypothetical protein